MNKTILLLLASPFLWFLSSSTVTAQDVAQSDQITDDGPWKIIQTTAAP